MKKMQIISTLALLTAALVLPACNTVKGVGKDIHDSAQNVQTWIEESDENRERLASNPAPNQSSAAYRNRY